LVAHLHEAAEAVEVVVDHPCVADVAVAEELVVATGVVEAAVALEVDAVAVVVVV